MERAEVKYPSMRAELVEYLRGLSDRDYQQSAWVEHNYPPPVKYDDLDMAIHFLFDDTNLSDDAEDSIGWFLYDESEAGLVSAVTRALDAVFDKYGLGESDEFYIHTKEWDAVLTAARAAHSALVARDPGHFGDN